MSNSPLRNRLWLTQFFAIVLMACGSTLLNIPLGGGHHVRSAAIKAEPRYAKVLSEIKDQNLDINKIYVAATTTPDPSLLKMLGMQILGYIIVLGLYTLF